MLRIKLTEAVPSLHQRLPAHTIPTPSRSASPPHQTPRSPCSANYLGSSPNPAFLHSLRSPTSQPHRSPNNRRTNLKHPSSQHINILLHQLTKPQRPTPYSAPSIHRTFPNNGSRGYASMAWRWAYRISNCSASGLATFCPEV